MNNFLKQKVFTLSDSSHAHGSADLCWRRQAKSMENGKIRPLADPRPVNRSTQNLKQIIMFARRSPVQNFVQIRPLGASRQRS